MQTKLNIKDSSIAFLTTVILCQFGTLFFAACGLIIASIFNVTNEMFFTFLDTAIGSLLLTIFMDGLIICLFFYFNKKKNNKILMKPNIKKVLYYICLAIVCYIILYPIVISFNSLIYKFYPSNDLTYSLSGVNYFISIISLVILPAIAEELIFRGIIFKGLQKGGNVFAIIISSIMFSIFHLSLEQTIYPFLMGLILAVIMCHENNIIYCITLHLTNNFLALTFKYFNLNLILNHWTYYLIALLCLSAFIISIVLAIKKQKTNQLTSKIENEHKAYFIICFSIVFIIWTAIQISTIFKG